VKLSLVVLLGLAACTPTKAPTPAPAPGDDAADPGVAVYGELVEAGCLAASDSGVAAVDQEHAYADQPSWLGCLFDGGSIGSCNVPCDVGGDP
jgi:hypothetical protein